ncbi:Prohibitin [Balamuthia mandrillaris]
MAQQFVPLLNRIAIGAAALGVVGYSINESMYTVDGGERALIFDKTRNGTREFVVGPGTHFLIPFLQYPIIYDVRTTPFNIRTETGSKDLQRVMITLRVLYKPEEKRLPYIYQRLGTDYSTNVFNSVGNEVLKAVVAEYNATELISRREDISRKIRSRLVKRAGTFGIILDDVAITHLTFSPEYVRAIEHKQVAQQLAEQAKFVVLKNEQEKLAKIIIAEGEAESAALIAKAMASGPGYIALRRIEAAKDIAAELARSRNVVYLPSGTNVLMNLPH